MDLVQLQLYATVFRHILFYLLMFSIDSQWKGLTGMLSGIFCASMEQMSISVTAEPKYSFQSETMATGIRYSILPREAVCTENLTPWIKLLPCRNKVRKF
jgi:phosphatidylinositol glycan class T